MKSLRVSSMSRVHDTNELNFWQEDKKVGMRGQVLAFAST